MSELPNTSPTKDEAPYTIWELQPKGFRALYEAPQLTEGAAYVIKPGRYVVVDAEGNDGTEFQVGEPPGTNTRQKGTYRVAMVRGAHSVEFGEMRYEVGGRGKIKVGPNGQVIRDLMMLKGEQRKTEEGKS